MFTCEHTLVEKQRESERTSHDVSLAGEFLVLAELARRRLDGTLTFGSSKEVDILVLNRRSGRTFRVEVKTTEGRSRGSRMFRRHYSWLMNVKHGRITDESLVYCFVLLGPGTAGATQRLIFLVPAVEVARYIRWNQRYWEKEQLARGRHGKESSLRQFRVPAEEGKVIVPRSWRPKQLWRTWEDNWETFGPSPGS